MSEIRGEKESLNLSSNGDEIPLLKALRTASKRPHAPFYAPGHKRGQKVEKNLRELLGKSVFAADLPELPELDNLFAPEGVIKKAQALAAETFGAEETRFLINGSTGGIIAAILATCQPGDQIILPRNVHQSVISGLILSGAIPVFLTPEYDQEKNLAYSITTEGLKEALETYNKVRSILLVYPTYHGICGDLESCVKIAHSYNIPVLVDEAHGGHFAFHPEFPPSALSLGADLTVQSTHKVLGSLTQSSLLHVQGNRIDRDRLEQSLQLIESSSPSYLLLASLDGARHQMATEGKELMGYSLELAEKAREKLKQISRISVLESPENLNSPSKGFKWLDRTRLTLFIERLGNGFELDEILHQEKGVTAELPLEKYLTFIVTFGNTPEDIEKLIKAFEEIEKSFPQKELSLPTFSPELLSGITVPVISPREAFFSPSERILLEKSVDRVSGETLCPYPPGIPIIMAGERITSGKLAHLQKILQFGGRIVGCSDRTLKTIKIIST